MQHPMFGITVLLATALLFSPAAGQTSSTETNAANLLLAGKYQEAIPYFTQLIARDPQNPYNFLNRAECYRHDDEHQLAVQDYDQSIEFFNTYRPTTESGDVLGDIALAYLRRGEQYEHLKQDDFAIRDGTQALSYFGRAQRAPAAKVAAAYQLRGEAYHNSGNDRQALDDYNRTLRLTPQDAYVFSIAGLSRLELGNSAKAQEDFERAIHLDPEQKSIVDQLIHFHEQGKGVRLYP